MREQPAANTAKACLCIRFRARKAAGGGEMKEWIDILQPKKQEKQGLKSGKS
jgi:hypothetical protein